MRTASLGMLFAVPNVANPTPVAIASLKGCKVKVKQGKAYFRGNMLDIIDVANKGRDWSVEVDNADFRASAFNLLAGGTTVAGGNFPAIGEQQTLTAGAATATNAATFVDDGGVYDLTAGLWMTRVASAPAAKQYSGPAAGVYTTAAGDNGHIVYLNYTYSSATLGQTTTINNVLQSQSVAFKLRIYAPYVVNGQNRCIGIDFQSVHSEEINFDFNVEDFAAQNLKFTPTQDMIGSSALVAKLYTSELG
jgi:hypothetical protein